MRVTQLPSGSGRPAPKAAVPFYNEEKKSGMEFDLKKILSSFEKDDYILAGLILVLVMEGCEDYILLAALGYLFIMGIKTV